MPLDCCEMDVPHSIVWYADDVSEWSDWLATFIRVNFEVSIKSQSVRELRTPLTDVKVESFKKAKVQVVVLSSEFLEYIENNPDVLLGKLFEPSRVIAVMCGVPKSSISVLHKNNLLSFDSWRIIEVIDKDPSFCATLHNHIEDILQNTVCGVQVNQPQGRFKLHPTKVHEGNSKVFIEFKEELPKGHDIIIIAKTESESRTLNASLRNPYLVKFVIPSTFFGVSQIIQIHVTCGTQFLGCRLLKCESKMDEMHNLLQTIVTPQSFMCQTLGLAPSQTEDLDRYLDAAFQRNVPKSGFRLLDFAEDVTRRKASEEYPTLLHFAAKLGLNELCAKLLDCPGADAACQIQNKHGSTPADLAATENHHSLASMLENFMILVQTAEMYTCMKSMSMEFCNSDYANLDVRLLQTLKIGSRFSLPPVSEILKPDSAKQEMEVTDQTTPVNSPTKPGTDETPLLRHRPDNSEPPNIHLYPRSQQELIQLIEDFKTEKYTIKEVELLFDSWQRRQNNQSFQQKQSQLLAMQQQYVQIQKRCQDSSKKPSALERFKGFLVKTVRKEDNPVPLEKGIISLIRDKEPDFADVPTNLMGGRRPWSCCSHASSTSDRSSTMSVLSMCSTDSGTVSDNGEERLSCVLEERDGPKLLSKKYVAPSMENNRQPMYGDNISHLVSQRLANVVPPLPSRSGRLLKPPSPFHRSPKNSPASYTSETRAVPCRGFESNQSPNMTRSPVGEPFVEGNPYWRLGNLPPLPNTDQAQSLGGYISMGGNELLRNADPDYNNVPPASPDCTYIEMQCEASQPSFPSASYVHSRHVGLGMNSPYLQDATYDPDRCDSVPDMPAPSVPFQLPHLLGNTNLTSQVSSSSSSPTPLPRKVSPKSNPSSPKLSQKQPSSDNLQSPFGSPISSSQRIRVLPPLTKSIPPKRPLPPKPCFP